MAPAGHYNRSLAHYHKRDKSTGHQTEQFMDDGYSLTKDDVRIGNTPLVDNVLLCIQKDPGYWGDLIKLKPKPEEIEKMKMFDPLCKTPLQNLRCKERKEALRATLTRETVEALIESNGLVQIKNMKKRFGISYTECVKALDSFGIAHKKYRPKSSGHFDRCVK
jgi:hypothetical protein